MDTSATSGNFYDHIMELCEIIAPRINGVADGHWAKGTGVVGAAEITGIDPSVLSNAYNSGYPLKYAYAETLIKTAFPNDENAQNAYRSMKGYPDTPAQIELEAIAKKAGITEPLPELKEFFAAGFRIRKGNVETFTTTNAQDLVFGWSECLKQAACSIIDEMGFKNGLEAFFAETYIEIQLYARRKEEMGPAIHAMRRFPKAIDSAEEGIRSKNISLSEIAKALGLSTGAISDYIQQNYIPPINSANTLVAFFQKEIGDLVASIPPLEAPQSGAWSEVDFYNIAKKMILLYPAQCERPAKTKASPSVIEWGNCLDAFIKTLGITETDLADRTKVSQTSISNYRKSEVVRGPNADVKRQIQEACGCKNDNEFLEYGLAAQSICQLRDVAAENEIFLKFRTEKLGIRQDEFEKMFDIPHSSLSNYESRRHKVADPESFTARLGFRAPEYLVREFQRYVAEQMPMPTTDEVSYGIGSVFRSLRGENMPAEFYFYQLMGLAPNPADFEAIAELRQRVKPSNIVVKSPFVESGLGFLRYSLVA